MVYAQEHDELRTSVRGLVSTSRHVRALDGSDDALWRRMADLDLPALAIAEEHGGVGYGVVELAVVLEEIGRAALPSPFLTTALAGLVLQAGGGDPELPGIASGKRRATVHLGGLVDGTARHVPDGDSADLLVVVGDGLVVDLGDERVRRSPLTTMDLTRGQAHLDLGGVPTRRLVLPAGVADRIASLAAVLVACEQIGGAERVLELSAAYAKERVQFGRPVGSFQAVKHLLADMLIELELARSAQQHALALAADPATPPAVLDAAARTARVACSRASVQLTGDAIRVHGGIGYTWEHDLHLYVRRARASAALFGDGADADTLATHAGLVPTTAGARS